MSIRAAIYTHLSGFAGLTALVGDRIWPNTFPEQPVFPGVVYTRTDGNTLQAHDGRVPLGWSVFQIDSFAADSTLVDSVAEQVRLALQGFTGTVAGVRIDGVLSERVHDWYEPEAKLWRVSRDFKVWHAETP